MDRVSLQIWVLLAIMIGLVSFSLEVSSESYESGAAHNVWFIDADAMSHQSRFYVNKC